MVQRIETSEFNTDWHCSCTHRCPKKMHALQVHAYVCAHTYLRMHVYEVFRAVKGGISSETKCITYYL